LPIKAGLLLQHGKKDKNQHVTGVVECEPQVHSLTGSNSRILSYRAIPTAVLRFKHLMSDAMGMW
jgi:hypothetical protein